MNEKTQSKSHLGSCPLLDSIQGGNWIQKRALDSNWIQKRVCDYFEALITMMTKTLLFSDVLIVIDVVIGDWWFGCGQLHEYRAVITNLGRQYLVYK